MAEKVFKTYKEQRKLLESTVFYYVSKISQHTYPRALGNFLFATMMIEHQTISERCYIMKRAALYIRVSTDEQAKHGFSLAEQKHDLEEYTARHGYAVSGVYADEGNTARKALSRRRELQRLLVF